AKDLRRPPRDVQRLAAVAVQRHQRGIDVAQRLRGTAVRAARPVPVAYLERLAKGGRAQIAEDPGQLRRVVVHGAVLVKERGRHVDRLVAAQGEVQVAVLRFRMVETATGNRDRRVRVAGGGWALAGQRRGGDHRGLGGNLRRSGGNLHRVRHGDGRI